jgi:hypothetical protein
MWSARKVHPTINQPTKLPNMRFVQCDLRDPHRVKELFERSAFSHAFQLRPDGLFCAQFC